MPPDSSQSNGERERTQTMFKVCRYADGSFLVWRDGAWLGVAHDVFDVARMVGA